MRILLALLTLPIGFLAGCGDDSSPKGGSSGGATSGLGGAASGGVSSTSGGLSSSAGTSGAATSSGGVSSGGTPSSGGAATGGSSPSGGSNSTGGANATGGTSVASGGVASATGGRGSGGAGGASVASGGTTTSGGTGGTPAAGAAGAPTGSGGAGNSGACTRDLLKSTHDAYFKALAAHDPSTLTLADNVKFTENGKALTLGSAGLWKSAGTLKYSHSALDTETCNLASQAVVPDGTMDIPLALRIKLQNQRITEIETIAVRPGDYVVSGQPFASNTAALIASGTSVQWQNTVPAAQRNTREQITGWMDKYFRLFPRGVCNTTSSCKRIENGGGSFSCSAGASCDAGTGSGQPALPSRLILADVETGMGVGFTMFQGNTDMHMFKMYGDQVHGVSAVLGAASSSGWN
jgi:hypothetical protein